MASNIFSKNNWCDFIIHFLHVWGSKETITQYPLFLEAKEELVLNRIIGHDTGTEGRFHLTDTGYHIINENLSYADWLEKTNNIPYPLVKLRLQHEGNQLHNPGKPIGNANRESILHTRERVRKNADGMDQLSKRDRIGPFGSLNS